MLVGWVISNLTGKTLFFWLGNKFEGLESRIWRVPLLLEVFFSGCLVKGVLNAPPSWSPLLICCDFDPPYLHAILLVFSE